MNAPLPSADPIGHDPASLLAPTALLDYDSESIQQLVTDRGWRDLEPLERIGAVYDYVRNEIGFGYNADDDIPATAVVADGYGQCNTKATLLMALLRAVDISCRFHAATIVGGRAALRGSADEQAGTSTNVGMRRAGLSDWLRRSRHR